MVERGGLENRCGCKPTQGSNPCLSAIKFHYNSMLRIYQLLRRFDVPAFEALCDEPMTRFFG